MLDCRHFSYGGIPVVFGREMGMVGMVTGSRAKRFSIQIVFMQVLLFVLDGHIDFTNFVRGNWTLDIDGRSGMFNDNNTGTLVICRR